LCDTDFVNAPKCTHTKIMMPTMILPNLPSIQTFI